jgi:hypothetical protein
MPRRNRNNDFRLLCSVCGRGPKTTAPDLLDLLRDPRIGTARETEMLGEGFYMCEAMIPRRNRKGEGLCGRVTCPEHAVLIGGKSFCAAHAPR